MQRVYDTLGRLTSYTDADANTSTTTYDIASRPVTTSDGKGTQTRGYDAGTERRGLLTTLTDSAAGMFTASYDTDGALTAENYPNGLRATTSYDETGTPTKLEHVKTSNCTTGCTWLSETVSEDAHGQTVRHASGLSAQAYGYDPASRLTRVEDTTTGGCTTRAYTVDADSNRTGLTSYAPGTGGACQTTTASWATTSTFDQADRITDSLYSYDDLGRINYIPLAHAGGTAVTPSYYVNDLVRSISRGSTSKTWTLDVDQQRFRTWTDGTTTKTNHYTGDGDSPAWIAENSTAWTRNIPGISGNLTAIQDSAAGTTLQFANLHGDIVATASTNPAILAPATTFEHTEFGEPRTATTRRYGWLGAKTRPADTVAGIVLMGVRLYLPTTGRFLQPDPVPGGSDNAYDYAGHDPINTFDLDGRWKIKIKWKRVFKAAVIGVSIAAMFTCTLCTIAAYGIAAYSAASAMNNARQGRWRAAGWDALGAISFGYGNRLRAVRGQWAGEAARMARYGRSGTRYRRVASYARYTRSRLARTTRRYDAWWHGDFAGQSVSVARNVSEF